MTNNDLPMSSIVVHTGDPSHKIHACALQLSDNEQSSKFMALIDKMVSQYQLSAKETEFGTIFVTSLTSVPSTINVFHVASGDLVRDIPILRFHLSLRRLGCGTRTALSIKPPSDAQLERFVHMFHLVLPRNAQFSAHQSQSYFADPLKNSLIDNETPLITPKIAVIMEHAKLLVELVKIALVLLSFLAPEYAVGDGFLCDSSMNAVRLFKSANQSQTSTANTTNLSTPDVQESIVCGPLVAMSAIVSVFVWRTKLSMLVKEVTKDPFTDPSLFRKKIASFQKSKGLPITHTLDAATVQLIDQALAMSSIGPSRSARMVLSRLKQVNTEPTVENFLTLTLQSDYTRFLWHGSSMSSNRPSNPLNMVSRHASTIAARISRPSVSDFQTNISTQAYSRGSAGFLEELESVDEDYDSNMESEFASNPALGSAGKLLQGGREFLASTLRRNVAGVGNSKRSRAFQDAGNILNQHQRMRRRHELDHAVLTTGIRSNLIKEDRVNESGPSMLKHLKRQKTQPKHKKSRSWSKRSKSHDPDIVFSSGGSSKGLGLIPLINTNLFPPTSPQSSSSSSCSSESVSEGSTGGISGPRAFANSILKRRSSVTQLIYPNQQASPARDITLKPTITGLSERYNSAPSSPILRPISPEVVKPWSSPFTRRPSTWTKRTAKNQNEPGSTAKSLRSSADSVSTNMPHSIESFPTMHRAIISGIPSPFTRRASTWTRRAAKNQNASGPTAKSLRLATDSGGTNMQLSVDSFPTMHRGIIPGIPTLNFFHGLQRSSKPQSGQQNHSSSFNTPMIMEMRSSALSAVPTSAIWMSGITSLPKRSMREYVGADFQRQLRFRRAISLPRVDCVPEYGIDRLYTRRRANSSTLLLQSSWVKKSLLFMKHQEEIECNVSSVRAQIQLSVHRLQYTQTVLDDLEKTCQENALQIDYLKNLYQMQVNEIQKYQERIVQLKLHNANTITRADDVQAQLSRLHYATSSLTEQLHESEEIVSSMKEGIEILGDVQLVPDSSLVWQIIKWLPTELYRLGDMTAEAFAVFIRWIDSLVSKRT